MHDRLHGDVLVVEDDHVLRELITRVLENEGYRVVGTCDGEAALLAFDDDAFDLLVTDWQIPGMTGVELAAEVRRRCPDVAVLLVSGSPGSAAEEQRRGRAHDEILAKPFAATELARRVGRTLRARQAVLAPA